MAGLDARSAAALCKQTNLPSAPLPPSRGLTPSTLFTLVVCPAIEAAGDLAYGEARGVGHARVGR
jgi:hypothetical protein